MDLEDLNYEHRKYSPWPAYGQSKLANLLFMAELDRRVRTAGWRLKSVAAHPGYAATNLQLAGPAYAHNPMGKQLTRIMNAVAGQSASSGARPSVRSHHARRAGGEYFGPKDLFQSGAPERVDRSGRLRMRPPGAAVGPVRGIHRRPLRMTSRPNSSTS